MNPDLKNELKVLCGVILFLVGYVCLAWLLLILTGCSLYTKKNVKSGTTAEHLAARNSLVLERAIEGTKAPNISTIITVSGSSNTVAIPNPWGVARHSETLSINNDSRQQATDNESWKMSLKTALPWSVALILGGLGVLLALFAYNKAKKSSPALAAALNTAETLIVRQMESVDEKLARSKDSDEQAGLLIEARRLEKERGKLKRN